MAEYIQVITTVEKKEDAQKVAKVVVEKRLAGCVQIIGPIISNYWWKEKIEVAEEWVCLIKSRRDFYLKLEETIREIHPYEVPEILTIPVINGNESYLDWLNTELMKGKE
jgi:Uncharacterized protein involved in tolerance to divalent cations